MSSWLTCSGWLTHISGHPSAAGRAQDRESSPARDRRSTTVPRHHGRGRNTNTAVTVRVTERTHRSGALPPPEKLPLKLGRSEPPSNTWLPGFTRVHIPNEISIGSAVLAQHAALCLADKHRHTYIPRYICSNSPHPALVLRCDLIISVQGNLAKGRIDVSRVTPCGGECTSARLCKSPNGHLSFDTEHGADQYA